MAKASRGRTVDPSKRAIVNGYRSGLEERVSAQLESLGIPFEYEKLSSWADTLSSNPDL